MYDEIDLLASNLRSSCQIEIKESDDHQLLDLENNVFLYTSVLREILGKVNSFSKLVAYCGGNERRMMGDLCKCREEVAAEATRFSNALANVKCALSKNRIPQI